MRDTDKKLKRLIAMAGLPAQPAPATVPPWFARRVVERWLGTPTRNANYALWERVSHRGLAVACMAMCLSLVLHGLWWLHRDSPEQLASQSIVRFFLPR